MRLQRVLVGGLVAVSGLLGGALGSLALAPVATAAPAAAHAAADGNAVFTGTVATGQPTTTGRGRTVWTYTVNVHKVYQGDIGTQRVQVRTVAGIEPCGLTPLKAHGPTYALVGRPAGNGYLVETCDDVSLLSSKVQKLLEQRFGQGRDPVPTSTPSSPEPVNVVSRSGDGPPSFTRLAAPGVALILIGLLGVFLIRRTNRRR